MKKIKPLIIAHRGESYDAPENTLASINLAWQRGAEAVEIDVHLSKDNNVIVIHDASTKRVSGKSGRIKNLTLDEIKNLDVGSWKNEKYKNEKIPTLEEVLKTIPPNKKLIIEIKSGVKILPFLKIEIKRANLKPNQIEIISFSYAAVKNAKLILPEHKILLLADLDYNSYTQLVSPPVEKLIEKVKKANLDGLNVWAGKILTKEFTRKVKSKGLLLYVWTVNDFEKTKELVSWGIDGITTDRANWMREKLL